MRAAAVNLGASQTDDRFEIIPKLKPGDITEWKIRCLDCPGKVSNILDILDFTDQSHSLAL